MKKRKKTKMMELYLMNIYKKANKILTAILNKKRVKIYILRTSSWTFNPKIT